MTGKCYSRGTTHCEVPVAEACWKQWLQQVAHQMRCLYLSCPRHASFVLTSRLFTTAGLCLPSGQLAARHFTCWRGFACREARLQSACTAP